MARAAVGAVLALAALGAAPGEARAPSRLMVQADEHSLVLSRQSLVRGPVLIQLLNRGGDPHDLRLRRIGGSRAVSLAETPSEGLSEARVRLLTGRYKLWCSLPGHAALGMRATLRVRRSR